MEFTCEEKLKMMKQNRNLLHELLRQVSLILTDEQINSIEAWPEKPEGCTLRSWIDTL